MVFCRRAKRKFRQQAGDRRESRRRPSDDQRRRHRDGCVGPSLVPGDAARGSTRTPCAARQARAWVAARAAPARTKTRSALNSCGILPSQCSKQPLCEGSPHPLCTA